jgi:hypothetical protein
MIFPSLQLIKFVIKFIFFDLGLRFMIKIKINNKTIFDYL